MRLTLLRHGETEANRRRLYYGATDLPLLPESARALRERADNAPAASRYYTSGMSRAEQTLEAIFGPVPHEILPGLRERNFGAFEMQSYEQLKDDPAYQAWIQDVEHNRCPGGESADEVRRRSLAAVSALVARGEDCLCVTHGGVIAAIMAHLFPEGKNRYEWQSPNGGGYVIEDGKYTPFSPR